MRRPNNCGYDTLSAFVRYFFKKMAAVRMFEIEMPVPGRLGLVFAGAQGGYDG